MNKTLLDISSRVTPANRHVHLVHRFVVPQKVGQLLITFNYAPKTLEDETRIDELILSAVDRYLEPEDRTAGYADPNYRVLHNLLTVSLDDPAGFRGAAHRGNPEQTILLSETEATPGFLAGPLASGLWELTISLHEIVTDICQFSLRIQATAEGGDGS
ncbi:hypothetical protein [Paenibacillus donghaensis]|uniref:Uncharacterized protein n=1 Tax=Paenibacillus donghaensis TaxID=414771 RepID=A0A2Z2KAG9_9BACL|nr:hypothetical protein [Paenibacillus donghaensis]ASA22477.1 hypothetical protein B9T62_17820 [Paenibacillus donghaensis]